MEFNKKLQELRKEKGLTQEELAKKIYVSRTAVSKWESNRGYPNIDSLKLIAEFFDVTLDNLLSSDEFVVIAKNESEQKLDLFSDLIFGLLDLGILMFFFLPLFSQKSGLINEAVTLWGLSKIQIYLKIIYIIQVVLMALLGISVILLQDYSLSLWDKWKKKVSLILSALGTFIFIISSQVYAATFLFIFLIIKIFIMMKK